MPAESKRELFANPVSERDGEPTAALQCIASPPLQTMASWS